MIKSTGSRASLPKFESQFLHILAVWTWESFLMLCDLSTKRR